VVDRVALGTIARWSGLRREARDDIQGCTKATRIHEGHEEERLQLRDWRLPGYGTSISMPECHHRILAVAVRVQPFVPFV
jgi:hypothetical protein